MPIDSKNIAHRLGCTPVMLGSVSTPDPNWAPGHAFDAMAPLAAPFVGFRWGVSTDPRGGLTAQAGEYQLWQLPHGWLWYLRVSRGVCRYEGYCAFSLAERADCEALFVLQKSHASALNGRADWVSLT